MLFGQMFLQFWMYRSYFLPSLNKIIIYMKTCNIYLFLKFKYLINCKNMNSTYLFILIWASLSTRWNALGNSLETVNPFGLNFTQFTVACIRLQDHNVTTKCNTFYEVLLFTVILILIVNFFTRAHTHTHISTCQLKTNVWSMVTPSHVNFKLPYNLKNFFNAYVTYNVLCIKESCNICSVLSNMNELNIQWRGYFLIDKRISISLD